MEYVKWAMLGSSEGPLGLQFVVEVGDEASGPRMASPLSNTGLRQFTTTTHVGRGELETSRGYRQACCAHLDQSARGDVQQHEARVVGRACLGTTECC